MPMDTARRTGGRNATGGGGSGALASGMNGASKLRNCSEESWGTCCILFATRKDRISSSNAWKDAAWFFEIATLNAVVIAPAAFVLPARPTPASALVWLSMQPDNKTTSPSHGSGIFPSSFFLTTKAPPVAMTLYGRSKAVPLWQQSMMTVSRTPFGKPVHRRDRSSSSDIMPLCW